ncbi:hypothetical protein GCWU000324_02307 [Kingella oralis ATCC 51147]|uniref:Uncharacterized protein n=1 Tax=Kingella oralis ATCC 51147 TaxID=629741 RepID=C4GJT4_9NEIS|nr:hypothetical protein GCWU000324_02307 [Kingella oralis ATCC 51147]
MMVSVGCHHAQTAAAPVRRKASPHAKRQPETPSKVSGCLFISRLFCHSKKPPNALPR